MTLKILLPSFFSVLLFLTETKAQSLSGTYTIGGSNPDYAFITDAVADLILEGVSGPVVFNIRPGVYNEQVAIPEIVGASAVNTITFQSENGDSTSVILTNFSSSSAQNYTLALDGADWVRIRQISLEATGTSYGRVLAVRNQATNNSIENNRLIGKTTTSTSPNWAVLHAEESNATGFQNENNTIQNNRIENGSYGIYWVGAANSGDYEAGQAVLENELANPYYRGLHFYNQANLAVRGNRLHTNTASTSFVGLQLYYCNNQAQIAGNRFWDLPPHRGFYFYEVDGTAAVPALAANNFIHVTGGAVEAVGIQSLYCDYLNVFHNTVHVVNAHINSSCYYNQYGGNIRLLNNLFVNSGAGYSLNLDHFSNSVVQSDYNDLFSAGLYLGRRLNNNAASLVEWISLSAFDSSSVTIAPLFLADTSFAVAETALDGAGTPLAAVMEDIEGDPRDGANPDIGADEFDKLADDAGLESFLAPAVPFAAGLQTVRVRLKNHGTNTLTTANILWAVDGVAQPAYNWAGSLASGDTLAVDIGQYAFNDSESYAVEAWAELPNGMADLQPGNDSIRLGSLVAGLAGTYTIGGANPDFATFTEAVGRLASGGVSGPATFNVRDGLYVEQVRIPAISGASSANTITFQSESGDSSLVALQYGMANSSANYTLLLDRAEWVRIRQLTLQSSGTTYSRVLAFQNEASNNIIENNRLIGYSSSSSSADRAVIHAEGTFNDAVALNQHNSIRNNRIENGSYGIFWFGNNNGGNYEIGQVVEANEFVNPYYRGLHFYYQDNLAIKSNRLSTNTSLTTFVGLQLYYCSNQVQVVGNQFWNLPANRGIYLYEVNGTALQPALAANNFIHITGSSAEVMGIHTLYCDHLGVYHNTVHVASSNINSSCYYNQYGANIRLLNNLFVNSGGGYSLYFDDFANAVVQSDHNDLYASGPNIGRRINENAAGLLEWTALTTFDSNSVAIDPLFQSDTSFAVTQVDLNGAGTPLAAVAQDIEGDSRDAVAPDIGADEFSLLGSDAGIAQILDPAIPFATGQQNIRVLLKNHGADPLANAQIHWTVSGVAQAPYAWSGNLPSADTLSVNLGQYSFGPSDNYSIKAWTEQPNGNADLRPANDTARAENLYSSLAGIYTIGGADPDFPTFAEAMGRLVLAGILGPVTFNVRDGVYNEQVAIPAVSGAAESSPITFQSESGDSSLVALEFAPAFADSNYTLLLDGARWITFRKMTLRTSGASFARVLAFRNESEHNTFENNCFTGYPSVSSTSHHAVIYADGTYNNAAAPNQFNTIKNNRIENGSYGVYWAGANNGGNYETGQSFEGNEFANPYYRGLYFYYQNNLAVKGNRLYTNTANATFMGLQVFFSANQTQIAGNRFWDLPSSHGFYLYEVNGANQQPALAANNFLHIAGGSAAAFGIETQYCDYLNLYHNTIRVANANANSSCYYNQYGTNIRLLNNLFENSGGSYILSLNNTSSVNRSDYNDFFGTGSKLYKRAGQETGDLPSWQAITSLDSNSVSVEPYFLADTSYQAVQSGLNAAATPVPEVGADIEGKPRDAANPDIGAYEFDLSAGDAGVDLIIPPAAPFAAGLQMIRARIKNHGSDNLSSVDVYWTVNGAAQATQNWAGSLASGDTLSLGLGQVDFQAGQEYQIVAWVANPNGGQDPVAANDTSSVSDLYSALAGNYTIGGANPDFSTFNEAVDALVNGGAIGPVVFSARDGDYPEQVRLPEIIGTDSINTVLFQSESGDSTAVTLSSHSGAAAPSTLLLDGADWVTFRGMTITAINGFNNRAAQLQNRATHNAFQGCVIEGRDISTTGVTYSTIYFDNTSGANEYNSFEGNRIIKGSYGLYLLGDFNGGLYESGNRATGNTFDGQYYRAIYAFNQKGLEISGNNIATSSTVSNYDAIYVNSCFGGTRILKNKILGLVAGAGINLNYIGGTAGQPTLVANNFVQAGGSANSIFGIWAGSGCDYLDVYHNSVNIANTHSASAAFYHSAGTEKNILNNLFVNTGGGYAYYANTTYGIARSDHNGLYATGANLGYWNGNQADLAAWVGTSQLDSNSVSIDPVFISQTDLHVTNPGMDNLGTSTANTVPDDIDGDYRDPVQPDIGADEFVTAQDDAGLVAIDFPSMPFAAENLPVYVTLLNNGLDTLTSAAIQWEINGDLQAPFSWAGSLLTSEVADSVLLGSFPFEIGIPYTIRAWTEVPNGMADPANFNDTARVDSLYAGLGGVYTIGGTAPDFADFQSALDVMLLGGVMDHVVFNVRDGVYQEQLVIPEIPGAGTNHTITFQSEALDTSAVTLSYEATLSSEPYTIFLDGADWVAFRHMTLQAEGDSYANVVLLSNGADNNRLEHNRIVGKEVSQTSANYAAIYSSGSNDNFNTYANNHFINGSYGIYLNGAGTSSLERGTIIEGNTFEGNYNRSVHLSFQDGVKVAGNDIFNDASGYFSYDGIYLHFCDNNHLTARNRIRLQAGNYGISIQNSDGTPFTKGAVQNNFIVIEGSAAGPGIYISNSTHQNIYHNSVRVSSSENNSYSFRADNGGNIALANNIFVNTSVLGSYALYQVSAGNINFSDYNDLYSTGPNFAYSDGLQSSDLADWQASTGFDQHSLSVDPLFLAPGDLHATEVDLNQAGIALTGVVVDFDGDPRNPEQPDIGADEFDPITTNDAGVDAFFIPGEELPFGEGLQPVKAVIKNNGADIISSVAVRWFVNGIVQPDHNWTGGLGPGERDTIDIGLYDFQAGTPYDLLAFTLMPNGYPDSASYNDTTRLSEVYAALNGVYTIGGVFPDFEDFSSAALILNRGGVLGPVTFNVRNGIYEERLALKEIKGSSAANTVCFQSQAGDSTAVVLRYHGASPDTPPLELDGTTHIRFKELTVESTYSHFNVISLKNKAAHVRLSNCRIRAPENGNNYLVIADNSRSEYLEVSHCRLENGYTGVYFRGPGSTVLEQGLIVEHNDFRNQANSAIFLRNQLAPAVNFNTITTQTNYSGYYGIYCNYCDGPFQVWGNEVSTDNGYGLYLFQCDGAPAGRGLIANNFVHLGGTATSHAVYLYSSDNIDVYYNTANVTTSHAGASAFYARYGSGHAYQNNIFSNQGGGYAIYVQSGPTVSYSNYNNLYAVGSALGNWQGFVANGLAQWQSLSGKDLQSISANPLFYDGMEDLHVLQVALDSAALPIADITEDIDGQPRDPGKPDIGADEFDYLTDDVGILALANPVSGCGIGSAETIEVVIQNYGGLPQSGFEVAYSVNGGPAVVENIGGLVVEPGEAATYAFSAPLDLSVSQVYAFELFTILPGELNPYNDTIVVPLENIPVPAAPANMLPADGSINIALPVSFNWLPSPGAERFDLYIWPVGQARPPIPLASDIAQITYVFSGYNLTYGATYNWQLVAQNDYCETESPVQQFTVRELPDLVAGSVQLPVMPFSGQSIEISWQVANNGSGGTLAQQWSDAVYLSTDDQFNPGSGAETYLGAIPNLTALGAGESYSQTANFMLPQGIFGEYWIFVVTDRYNAIVESDNNNNTGGGSMNVNLTPSADLQASSVIAPNNAFSGQGITVSWTVTNEGGGPTTTGFWRDAIYVSDSDAFNSNIAAFLGVYTYDSAPLEADSSYSAALTVTLPNGIFGDYFIHVRTDYVNQAYEFIYENNNIGTSSPVNVVLTPPPDLVVTNITALDTVNNRQQVLVKYDVENQGASPIGGFWTDYVYFSRLDTFNRDSLLIMGTVSNFIGLGPGQSLHKQRLVTIPASLHGEYYLYVEADRANSVFEYNNEDNNITRSGPFFVVNADLVVENVNIPAAANSGEEITVSWAIRNNGPGRVISAFVRDEIYLSGQPAFDPGTATSLGLLLNTANLLPGGATNRQKTVELPEGISGTYYLFVQTDYLNLVQETGNEDNNVSGASIVVGLSPTPDLQVSQAGMLPDSIEAGTTVPISFTVANVGPGAAAGTTWADHIYVSVDSIWDPDRVGLLKNIERLQSVNAGGNYTVNADVTFPMLSLLEVGLDSFSYVYLYFFTDAEDALYEHEAANENNILRSPAIHVTCPPPVDLEAIASGSLPDSALAGQELALQWTVKNNGSRTSYWNYNLWYDAVYLSTDTIWDSGDAFIKDFTENGPLEQGASYTDNQSFTLPDGISGNFYLLLVADHRAYTNDGDPANNVWVIPTTTGDTMQGGGALPIYVAPGLYPDLKLNAFDAPAQGTSGQPIEIAWEVENLGNGAPGQNWTDKAYLSTDFVVDSGDPSIAAFSRSGPLPPGGLYRDTMDLFLPVSASGNYVLIFKTDANNTLFEPGGEGDNALFSFLAVTQPAPADLAVKDIAAPAMAMAGDSITIGWTVQNQGSFPAQGYRKDILYFSEDTLLDLADVRLPVVEINNTNLPPLSMENRSLTAPLPGVPLGNYYILVQTDALNNIYETSDANNVMASAATVMVTVPELPLGVLTPDVLPNGGSVYYRIEIPDSLSGETLLATLKGDSINGNNELYLSFGEVPTRSNHDFAFPNAFFGNQEILIPELQAGTYYLMAYGVRNPPAAQDITLKAEVIPFQLRSVQADRGGNTGGVTVKLRGARFEEGMDIRLEQAGQPVIYANNVFLINSTELFATFGLAGATQGYYDVVAEKGGGQTALLEDGFEVIAGDVSGTGGSGGGGANGFYCSIANLGARDITSASFQHPSNTRLNRVVPITIQFGNSGNIDVPIPCRFLISLRGAPLSFKADGFGEPAEELLLVFREEGGPPDVLRPGATGTITVYARSVAQLRFLLK